MPHNVGYKYHNNMLLMIECFHRNSDLVPLHLEEFVDKCILQQIKCLGSHDHFPPSSLNFVATLLGGYNIDKVLPASSPEQTAAYSTAQLICFNSVKCERLNRPQHTRHHVSHEIPLPVYLGLIIHNRSRKKSVVDKLNHLGLCISHDRVQRIEATVTNVRSRPSHRRDNNIYRLILIFFFFFFFLFSLAYYVCMYCVYHHFFSCVFFQLL